MFYISYLYQNVILKSIIDKRDILKYYFFYILKKQFIKSINILCNSIILSSLPRRYRTSFITEYLNFLSLTKRRQKLLKYFSKIPLFRLSSNFRHIWYRNFAFRKV